MQQIFFIGANNPETERMIRAVAQVQPVEFIGFVDNDASKKGTVFCGLPVIGGFESLHSIDPACKFVNLITRDALTRFETTKTVLDAGFNLTSFIHPNVDLTLTEVSEGAYIQEAVVLQAEVKLGLNTSIHMGSLIGHETVIGDHTFVAHGVTVSGCVTIGPGCFVGAGSTLVPRITIGEGSTIGAGAVITKDVPAWSVVVGNPGRVIRELPPMPLV